MIHDLKCWPEYFQAVKSGIKPFELRKDDRGYAAGDILHLREFDPDTALYTGDEIDKTVTYVLPVVTYGAGNDERYVIMGLAPRDWTPCAEGTPTLNDDGSYREVRATYKTWRGTLTVTDAVYMPEYDEWFEITHDGQVDLENVIAWKPQDEPYRADDTAGKVKEVADDGN